MLKFTQGNPLTIPVTIGEALRAGIDGKVKLDAFVVSLRGGETKFEDEAAEGRTKSLGASLSYGFASAFSEDERKQLALLHLFQGFVDVDTIRSMGNPNADWAVDEVRGLTREQAIGLLAKAAETGLLISHGAGYYGVHPALPWYFRNLFESYYTGDKADRPRRAFVEAMGDLANYYARQYNDGNGQVLDALTAEEDNLLAAWCLARENGWWGRVIFAMQGLRTLYDATGRGPAWRRMVEAVTPNFVDPDTDLPLPGREEDWSEFTEYRVRLAREELNLVGAERLQRLRVDWNRRRARSALATAPERRSDEQRDRIRSLATSAHELGEVQRQIKSPACAESYREAFSLAQSIADRAGQAICTFNLGNAYMDITSLRDFDVSEQWLKQSLDLRLAADLVGRGRVLGTLGELALHRFDDASKQGRRKAERLRFLEDSVRCYQKALELFPATATTDLGVTHHQLGMIFLRAGDINRALQHYQQTIKYHEQADDIFRAGQTRENVAIALFQARRFDEARAYAEAALANYQSFGDRAAGHSQDAERLLATIDQAAVQKGQKT